LPNAKFKIEAKSDSTARVIVKARSFELVIDEPENLGGDDKGANPVEFILAGLAGCLNVVGNLVAKEMGIELKNLSFEIEGDLNPLKFMGKSKEQRAGFQNINAYVSVETDASEDQMKKWIEEVEDRCPVSDNLANITPLKISLK